MLLNSTSPTSGALPMRVGHERVIFGNNFLFLDFPPEEDVLRQKYIKLKIFSIKFSTKKILIVEAVNTAVDALRARKKESYYFQRSKKCKYECLKLSTNDLPRVECTCKQLFHLWSSFTDDPFVVRHACCSVAPLVIKTLDSLVNVTKRRYITCTIYIAKSAMNFWPSNTFHI